MIYVLDTNIIRTLLFHFPKKGELFANVWNKIDSKIEAGEYISVDECFNELERQFSKDAEAYNWIRARKAMFKNPSNDESIIISRLFLNPKMRESIHTKNILQNRPSADPYIVAKAKSLSATVVTTETHKPNSAQLPNLCDELGVICISYDDFMEIVVK